MDEKLITQAQRFEQAARDALCDEDEARWDEKLRKVAAHKPIEPNEGPQRR